MTVALALDLGGTKLDGALVDVDGVIVEGSRCRVPTGPHLTKSALSQALQHVINRLVTERADVSGVGIGSAGPVDLIRGQISPLNMPGLAGFEVVAAVYAALPDSLRTLPVRLALDGQCIALAEQWKGAGIHARSMLGMVVSTGIGGGIVEGGRPLRGGTGNAGHIGQTLVPHFTETGASGLDTTLERVASGPNSVRWAKQNGWNGETGEDLGKAYAQHDPIALAAVRRSAAAVGAALVSAGALLDVDVIVIGGGFANVAPEYVELVRDSRDELAPYSFAARAAILRAELGATAPLVGAAALVLTAENSPHYPQGRPPMRHDREDQ